MKGFNFLTVGRMLLLAAVTVMGVSEAGAQTWDCGEVPGTVTATLSNGTLTISGSGAMKDYTTTRTEESVYCPNSDGSIGFNRPYVRTQSTAGWSSNITSIGTVVIGESVTRIGANAFYYSYTGSCSYNSSRYTNITSIVSLNPIPPTVGSGAFGASNVTALYIPASNINAYIAETSYWKDFTIKAVKSATVTFDTKGGSEVSPQAFYLVGGDRAVKPADPTLPGYLVEDWYKDAAYSAKWNFYSDTVTADMTLYVKWVKGYFITWNADGGSSYSGSMPATVVDGGSIADPGEMTKYVCVDEDGEVSAGYCFGDRLRRDFGGWYFDADFTRPVTFPVANVTEPPTFYAKWTDVGVTRITGIPIGIKVSTRYTLAPTVVPSDATNRAIVWSIEDAGTTDVVISDDNALFALSKGPIVLKATIAKGNADGTDYVQLFNITVGDQVISVLSNDRVVPSVNPSEKVAIAVPANRLIAEFAAGPNPAVKSSGGVVKFFRSGAVIKSASLRVYDASGNVVTAVAVRDNAAVGGNGKRSVGSWDLRDAKGRPVSEGTYLVRGVVKTKDGKSERVSLAVGVR